MILRILAVLLLVPSLAWAQSRPVLGGGGTPTGGAGTPNAGVVSVQGVSGGTAVPVFGGDTVSASAAISLGSGNLSTYPNGPAPSGLNISGEVGASFTLAAGGTLVAILTPQCSADGGATYPVNGYIIDSVAGTFGLTTTIASAQAQTVFLVLCPQGTSHVQLFASTYTSGSATFTGRASAGAWPTFYLPVVSASPTYTTGKMNTPTMNTGGGIRVSGAATTDDPYTNRVAVRVTTATTTAILAAVASKVIRVYGGSVCVDGAGVTTTVTLEDNSGSPIDLFSGTTTTTPYQLLAGQCLDLTPPMPGTYIGKPLTSGQNFQIVTGQAGPVNVVVDLRQE